MFTKNNFKQHISILEDGASGEQVGDIKENNCQKLVQNRNTLHEIDESSNKNYYDLKFIMNFKEYEKKIKVQNI